MVRGGGAGLTRIGGLMARPVRVTVTVNGREESKEVEPRLLLVHFLRDTLGLTGTHVGCDTSNCGYCTPGMIMAAADLLERNPRPSEEEVREGLAGNLCRCTGYHNIVKAVMSGSGQDVSGTETGQEAAWAPQA